MSGRWRNFVEDEKDSRVLALVCTHCSSEEENIALSKADRKTGEKVGWKTDRKTDNDDVEEDGEETDKKADKSDNVDGWCSENCNRIGVWTEPLQGAPGHH